MLKNLQKILMVMLVVFTYSAKAESDPSAMMENLTNTIIGNLQQNKSRLASNPDYIYTIVDRVLVPHTDFNEMGKRAVGPNAWRRANSAERKEFISVFQDLVIRTYSGTLNNYDNQQVVYLPLRGSYSGKKRVQINSKILESGRAPLLVSYRLINKGSSWKVYDIIIEGVSLLKGYNAQFSDKASKNGLGTVIAEIRQHNAKLR